MDSSQPPRPVIARSSPLMHYGSHEAEVTCPTQSGLSQIGPAERTHPGLDLALPRLHSGTQDPPLDLDQFEVLTDPGFEMLYECEFEIVTGLEEKVIALDIYSHEHIACVNGDIMETKLVKVAIVLDGRAKDLQPFLLLACNLRAKGWYVVILTNVDLVEICRVAGVDAVATFANCENIRKCGQDGETVPQDEFPDPSQVLVDHRTHLDSEPISDRVSDPNIILVTWEPTIVLCTRRSLPVALRYEQDFLVPAIPVFFKQRAFVDEYLPPRPCLFATSNVLDPKQCAANPWCFVTGPWFSETELSYQDYAASTELRSLRAFLSRGTKPIVFCWGAMTLQEKSPRDQLRLVLRTLRRIGRRGVVLGDGNGLQVLGKQFAQGSFGKMGLDRDTLRLFCEENVFFAKDAPHVWVLAQCDCIVHDGNIDIAHAAIRTGCPSVVTAISSDQFQLSRRINELKIGVGMQSFLRHLDVTTLACSIREAIHAISKRSSFLFSMLEPREQRVGRCRDLAQKACNEVGTSVAADLLDAFVSTWVETGSWRQLNAATSVRKTC